jgi:hypothetical protein
MVVACIALLVALTGTSIAAVTQLVPRNSVGPAQLRSGAVTRPKLRNNAVNTTKVANRSLRAIDFAAGQLPAGPAGPQGPAGAAGPAGPAGASPRWALVAANGTIPVQSGGISITATTGAGGYYVNFGSSIAGKLLIANSSDMDLAFGGTVLASPCGGGSDGVACVPAGTNTANHAFVFTSNSANTAGQPHAFYVSTFG